MGAGTASSNRATSWSMLVPLKAGWMMTLWMGMTTAPTPERSTEPRLTAQLVGFESLGVIMEELLCAAGLHHVVSVSLYPNTHSTF